MAEKERPILNPGAEALGKAEVALQVLHELIVCLDLPEDKKAALKSALTQRLLNMHAAHAANMDAASGELIRRAAAIEALTIFINSR